MLGGDGFEEQDAGARVGDGVVLKPAGDDDDLAGVDDLFDDFALFVAHLHPKAAGEDEEEFVFVGVVVPGELAFEFGELDLLPVELGDDVRRPCRVELGELVVEVDGFNRHGCSRVRRRSGC